MRYRLSHVYAFSLLLLFMQLSTHTGRALEPLFINKTDAKNDQVNSDGELQVIDILLPVDF